MRRISLPILCLFVFAVATGVACVTFGAGDASSSSSSSSSSSGERPGPPSADMDGSRPDVASPPREVLDSATPVPYAHAPCNGLANCPRYVFVTSKTFTGDLRIPGLNGVTSGDEHCTQLAAAAGAPLAGRLFKAWLSSDEDTALTVAAVRLVQGTEPYVLPDGRVIAKSWSKLAANDHDLAIDLTELGVVVSPSPVWTGSLASGAIRAPTCNNWEGNSGNGWTGTTNQVNEKWTNDTQRPCSQEARLYCIER